MIWAFIEIFYGRGTLYERVMLASFVTHMLYYGTEYILHQKHGHTIGNNWMSRETRTDCHIASHAAVNYVRMMRNYYPHLPCPLSNIGSDCCEDFFSLLGQQVKNKHIFSVGEAIERCSHIGRIEQIKYSDNEIKFSQSRRRKNIWWLSNAQVASANMCDYASVTDEILKKAWREGVVMAQNRAERTSMKEVLQTAGKWTNPCPPSFSHESLVHSTHEYNMKNTTNDIVDDGPLREATIVLQSTLLHVEQGDDVNCFSSSVGSKNIFKHSSTVEVPGKGQIYKMRLISELNIHSLEKLPLDRLRRVKYKNIDPNIYVHDDDQVYVGLFDDVGLLFDEGEGKLVWHIGRVQKIVKTVGEKGAKVDYVRSVSLSDENISILPKYYKHIAGLEYTYGGYEGAECDFIGLESIICIVSIVINVDKDVYTLAPEDRDALNKHLDCEMKRRGSCSGGRDREKEYVTPIIATTPTKRGRPRKDPLVFVNTNPTSTLNTPLRRSTRLKN